MCQIIVKPKEKEVDFNKLCKTEKFNSDGYGLSWYCEKDGLQTFRTMDFDKFQAVAKTLKEHDAVLHLRKTSKGETTIAYTHPFEVPTGVMFHNGTIFGLGDNEVSDTAELADILMECEYDSIGDIRPLLETIIGNKYNKLVFQEYDGTIIIVNELNMNIIMKQVSLLPVFINKLKRKRFGLLIRRIG